MTTSTAFETARFGTIHYGEEDIVTFPDGLIGLSSLNSFVLVQHREGTPFRWLQSLEDPSVAFLVVEPGAFTDNYCPILPDSASSALELAEGTPILVYTICTIPNGNPRGMTINLAGPLVINAESRRARQVVVEDESCPVRYAVFQEREGEAA
jgi:flagellar assembly factor FliW